MSEMKGKVCIVTGSNSGMGKETAMALANMGATVVMVVRNRKRGEKALTEVINKTGTQSTVLMICDMSSAGSIRKFAKEFAEKYERLDVLINNAGAVFSKRQLSVDGFELTLAVDYLGPFLLTQELLPLLKSGAPSRIINIVSGLFKLGRISLDDIQNEKNYKGFSYARANAYANAKLMLLMFTYELARRLQGTRVTVNAVQPGLVATNLGKNSGSRMQSFMFMMMRPFLASPRKGSETAVYLASSHEVEGVTGKCFSKLKEISTTPITYDQQVQKSLWDATMKMLGLTTGS
jgi:NAD(P)-dependent dehydrogenase (short-subunit alcohol dehydrogenase family)